VNILEAWLTDVHYLHFMIRKDFWYRKDQQATDMRLCVLLSDMNTRQSKAAEQS